MINSCSALASHRVATYSKPPLPDENVKELASRCALCERNVVADCGALIVTSEVVDETSMTDWESRRRLPPDDSDRLPVDTTFRSCAEVTVT